VLYFDTSFIVPLLRPESNSTAVSAFLSVLQPAQLAVSQWTRVEVFSALAREVRVSAVSAQDANEAIVRFNDMLRRAFTVLLPDQADFETAARYVARFESGLRAGDALHLAIAANRSASAIYTLDKGLIAAGKILGLPVKRGIEAGKGR